MKNVTKQYEQLKQQPNVNTEELDKELGAARLENSYAGILGKSIEPAIAPLGYDWKIGIALITSFAAREVFVGTMATLYSVGDQDKNDLRLRDKMKSCKKRRWHSCLYTCLRFIANDLLCICHAMHEYISRCKT
jgi:ferrous iron transport protein B